MPQKKILTLEALPARKGDCLLLHFGTKIDQKLCVIDGGPSKVYKPHLRPRLMDIRKKRQLAGATPLIIDLLMISHIDDDHIKGILDMTKDLIKAMDEQRPRYLEVRNLWHNSFDEIIDNDPKELAAAITSEFGPAALGGQPPVRPGLDPHASMVLASVRQGHRLRNDANKLGWTVNAPFDGLVMMRGKSNSQMDKYQPDLNMTIVGPMREELRQLQIKYDKFLEENDIGRNQGEAALAAFEDRSIANLSSLVVLVEADSKTILLTGDARGDKILASLKKLGLTKDTKPLKVDVLKMPHHGSDRNIAPEFFEDIIADHYVFCGDGEHGNPERETMEMLFDARPEGGFSLHFTYDLDDIDETRQEEHEKKGRTWKPAIHNLGAFFYAKASQGIAFTINQPEGKKSVRIDLLKKYPH